MEIHRTIIYVLNSYLPVIIYALRHINGNLAKIFYIFYLESDKAIVDVNALVNCLLCC